MTAERHKNQFLWTGMLGMVFSDPEALLFCYALAFSKGDEDSLEIAKFYKKQAEELGVTKDQFINALDAMKKTDELIARLSDEAS
jgi:hypothetical protein